MRKVSAIIVTYANRFKLVEQVIKAAFKEGVDNIVLVDNASEAESYSFYNNVLSADRRVHLIRHEENLGSSGGFKAGIDFVVNKIKSDLVWLLDDDNVPLQKSLKSLLLTRELLLDDKISDVVLYSYRGNTRAPDKNAVFNGHIKKYTNNNFLGLNFLKALMKRFFKRKNGDFINYPIVRVYLGPYGGAFFSADLLNKIGLPNEAFFVYADDHEFTQRVNDINIDQFLVYSSKLEDIDNSFDEDGVFSRKTSEFKIYYSIRNHVYLNKNHITCRFFYNINKILFLCVVFKKFVGHSLRDLTFSKTRFKLILKAIKDGELENLNEKPGSKL